MGSPAISTAKALFALSGNRCAFPECSSHLIDEQTNVLAARICHIKGNRKGSARHDEDQSEEVRQGAANLVVMCPNHADIIDNRANVDRYTVDWLLDIKVRHEDRFRGNAAPPEDLSDRFAVETLHFIISGPVVISAHQSGGQTANTIINYTADLQIIEAAADAQLEARNLYDPSQTAFGTTRYSKRLGYANEQGEAMTLPSSGILFAVAPRSIIDRSGRDELMAWMNPNERRYEPIPRGIFIPSTMPDVSASGLLWHDGHQFPMQSRTFSKYLAIEFKGYIEYGFYPGGWLDRQPQIYYAKVLANAVAFFSFLKDLADRFTIDVQGFAVGLALRGIRGKSLKGITESLRLHPFVGSPPEADSWLYRPEPSVSPWTADSLAEELAHAILEHWSLPLPAWTATPEFNNGSYVGGFFKKNFSCSEVA